MTSVYRQAGSLICNKIVGDAHRSAEFLETTISIGVLLAAREFVRRFDWITVLPTNWVNNRYMQKFFMLCEARKLRDNYIKKSVFQWMALGSMGLISKSIAKINKGVVLGTMGLGFGYCAVRQAHMVKIVKESYISELTDRNSLHPM